jgi:hypothetical protein
MKPISYSQLPIINCPICNCGQFSIVSIRCDSGRVVRCLNCRHIYLNPTLDKVILDEICYNCFISNAQVEEWFLDPGGPYQVAFNCLYST